MPPSLTHYYTCCLLAMPSIPRPPRFFKSSKSRPNKNPCILQSFFNLTSKGDIRQAVDSLPLLRRMGIRLDSKSIASLIQKCASTKSIKEGKWVHLHLKLTGLKRPNTFLSNHLINMYTKFHDHVKARQVFDEMSVKNLYSWNNMLTGYVKLGMVKPARRLFDRMPERDVVSWNTMIVAYAQGGWFDEAFRFYKEFRRSDVGINEYSFAGVIFVSVKLRDLRLAQQVHCQVCAVGFLNNVVISSSIVDAYAKCGEIRDATRLFDEIGTKDVLAWTTLLSGYAKCGDLKSARAIFGLMPRKNSVSWTALISGCAQNGKGREALKLFSKMITLQVPPDQFTFSSCLFACASIVSLEHGRQIHGYLLRTNIRPNTVVICSLIDMYSKCGSLEVGKRIFDMANNKQDIVLWNTIISAFAQHGCGEQAMKMFVDMVRLGVKPDRVTLLALLSACSHSGLIQEGLGIFKSMAPDHNIFPDQEHYACLIDLLGRAGYFDEVVNQLKKMPCEPDDRVWNALLGVCAIHGNLELARIAAKHLIELEPQSPAAYLLLSGIYAILGRWKCAEEVRRLMSGMNVKKDQALSWVEIEQKLRLDNASGEGSYSVVELLAAKS